MSVVHQNMTGPGLRTLTDWFFVSLVVLGPALIGSFGSASGGLGQCEDDVKIVKTEVQRLKRVLDDRLSRVHQETDAGDLDARVGRFRVQNAPFGYAILALNELGVDICHETITEREEKWYIDTEGVPVFPADKLISISLVDATVREILDKLVQTEPRYTWAEVPGTRLVNVVPKKSQLCFELGPIQASGDLYDVLRRISARLDAKALSLGAVSGSINADVSLNLNRCSGLDVLNNIVRHHSGLTWHYANATSFRYLPSPSVKRVDIRFSDVKVGNPTNMAFQYVLREREVDGIATMVAIKRGCR